MNDPRHSTVQATRRALSRPYSWHRKTAVAGRCAAILITLLAVQSSADAQFPFRQPENFRQPQSPYEPLRQRGFAHYEKGEYQQAVNVATQILNFEPRDPVAFYLRASAKIELGRQAGDRKTIRSGIQDARQALAIRGADEEFTNLYIPYLYGMSWLAVVERNVSHADTAVKTAGSIIDKPGVADADKSSLLYQRAFARQQAAVAEAAQFDRAAATPEEFQKFQAAQTERQQAAIADYAKAIQLNPKQMGAHINMAKALAAVGESDRSLSAFDAAIQEFPRNATIYNERGVYHRQLGQLDEAIADFTQAIDIQRNFAMGYINRGFCLTDKGEDEAAEADFNTAISLDPRMSLAYSLRGTARMSLGKVQPAIADFSKQLELNPRDATAYANRGFARFFAKQFGEAAQDFRQALELQPTAYHLAVWRALSLVRAGQADAAKSELEALLASQNGPQGWVADLCKYLLGQTTGEELIAAAKEVEDQQVSLARVCEAQFFIGQHDVIDGNPDAANTHFTAAVDTGVRYLSAYRGSKYELGEFSAQ